MHRHYHVHPYAAVVVSGGYEEAGESGRRQVQAGDVLIHPPFSAHCDRVPRGTNRVLDIPLPFDGREWMPFGRVADPDALVRAAQQDPQSAVPLLIEQFEAAELALSDLPDQLASALDRTEPPAIAAWAAQHGVARETLSRSFQSLYQVSPNRYRIEARARRAWRTIIAAPLTSLADIAVTCGYADQAHLTRDVAMLTGLTPGAWRNQKNGTSHSFKT